jgi:ferredoxin
MAVLLTLLVESAAPRRGELAITPGTSILKAAHAAGVDVTATCGGRGRCTSCRVKFVAGTVPPPTIGDEVQLGDALVREAIAWPASVCRSSASPSSWRHRSRSARSRSWAPAPA